MEIENMNLEQIETRKAEIVELLKGDCDVDALTEEVDKLEARAKQLREEAEKRSALAAKVAAGAGKVLEAGKMEKMSEEEKRAAAFAESGHMEFRALLSTGTIAKPTKVGGVNELADAEAGIVDDVNAIPLTGNGAWTASYRKTASAAADVTDGEKIGGTAGTFGTVTINPGEWGILDEISKQVKKMTPIAYEASIRNAALSALRVRASGKIVAAIKASELAEKVYERALDADFLRATTLGFKAIKGKGNVVLYISLADILALGKVRGTNEKKALYGITFDAGTTTSGTISEGGMAVRFRILDELEAGIQLFGQPGTVDMPMWDGYTIETDEGGEYFQKNLIGIKGLQTAGVDLVAYHGMQVIHQAKASL